MAGIGIKLNRIFEKNTLMSTLAGAGYSIAMTITPMLLVIADIVLMQSFLGYSELSYSQKLLLSCTLLYVFIFSMIVAAPFNSVLSKFISDSIFEEHYDYIMPCFYTGLFLNMILGSGVGAVFCYHEYFTGGVGLLYVFTGFCCFLSLIFIFYTMMYLSICKDYGKISLFYLIGLVISFVMALILVKVLGMPVDYSILLSITTGFIIIGGLGFALLKQYFTGYVPCHKKVMMYFVRYWKLVLANTLYTVGIYVHNFVFWTSDLKLVVAKSFVCVEPYDLASSIAMFTNVSASVIFISMVEMHFHERYKQYSEAVIGGRWSDIKKSKSRMFRLLSNEIMDIVRLQFIISAVIFLVLIVLMPQFGFSSIALQIYPCLCAGYFVLFIMYALFIFFYYFNDMNGICITGLIFFTVTLGVSILCRELPTMWYGLGLFAGAVSGWTYGFFRLIWVEKNLDLHIFCQGSIMKRSNGKQPSGKVFDRYAPESASKKEKVNV